MFFLSLIACQSEPNLSERAYVVSYESNELFVFDYSTLEAVASIDTTVVAGGINGNHMAVVTPDGLKVYVTASNQDNVVVVDATTLEVTATLPIARSATHIAMRPDSAELWIMAEADNAVVVLDTTTDTVLATISDARINTPHFVHFSGDHGYVPSIGGNEVAIVDLARSTVVDSLVGDGLASGPCEGDPCGYADAQIDSNGVLFASNFTTGKVIVYDTVAAVREPDVSVGLNPWSAFVDPFSSESAAFVPSWRTATVSKVDASGQASVWSAGGSEVYGVNFSAQAPGEAFVLDRSGEQVSVLDRESGEVLSRIDVGGTTETGATTPDGRLLLPVSSTGEVIVIDTATHQELARFTGVGTYPWSATTVAGQNYCH